MADTYKETITFEHSNIIARVFVPDLTQEERTRRMNRIHNTAKEMLKTIEFKSKGKAL